MREPRLCPKCDAPLLEDSPAGLCPKCLLQAGFENEAPSAAAEDPSAMPTVKSPAGSFQPGFEPPSPEQLAPLFPQLEMLELLGKGGMGAVYKARQKGLDRLVAVKILPPEVGQDPAFAERFTREARAMAKLNHPQIVAIHDFGQANGQYYFVMEYVEGANLRQVLQAKQLMPTEALAIVPQICDALQYAHNEGIVHRDIKPENILVDTKGRVKIADFGLSKLLHHDEPDVSLTGTHQVMGTLRYMAPEQIQGTKSVDHRADIYSLGVVFYELLTGQVPMGRFDPPSQKVQIDVRLDEVVLRALAQEPDKRYQRASEVKADVEIVSRPSHLRPTATADTGVDVPSKPDEGVPSNWIKRFRFVALVLCFFGIALGLFPWSHVRAVFTHTLIDGKYIYADGTFDFRSGIWAQQFAHGYETWQGLAVCCSFFALGCALLGTLHSSRIDPWRYAALIITGLVTAVAALHAIAEQPRLYGTMVQWAAEPAELQAEHRAQKGSLSDEEFLRVKLSENIIKLEHFPHSGPYLALTIAACLFVIGLAELREFQRVQRTTVEPK